MRENAEVRNEKECDGPNFPIATRLRETRSITEASGLQLLETGSNKRPSAAHIQ